MAFKIKSTLQVLQTHMLAAGHFSKVMVGEPKAPPAGERLVAAIYMDSVEMDSVTLNGTMETHTVTLRLYEEMQARPVSKREDDIDTALANLEEDIFGDFSLNDTVRNIDVTGVATEMIYLDVGGTPFRVAEMTLPFIVDDSASLVK